MDASTGDPDGHPTRSTPADERTEVMRPVGATGRVPDPEPDPADATPPADETAAADAETEVLPAGTPTPTDEESEPVAGTTRRRRRGRRALIWTGVGIVVLAAAYVGGAWFLGDRVPGNTTVAGVDISSLPVDEAVRVLEEGLADLQSQPVPVAFGETTAELDPTTAGIALDARATVDEFTGFTLDPRVVLGHLFGLGAQPVVSDVDVDALTAAVTAMATQVDVPPVEGAIAFAEGQAVVTEPVDGTSIDVEPAVELVADEWLTAERPLTLPSVSVPPVIGEEQLDAAMTDLVEPMLSAPVTVAINDTTAELTTAELATFATIAPEGEELALTFDGQGLAELVTSKVPSVGEAPQDAQIVLKDGAPVVIPAVTGTGLDPDALGQAVGTAATTADPAGRTAAIELAQTEADFTTEEAEALGVTEVIGTFSTPYPYDPTRTPNLRAGTANINGTLVQPGEQFSLLEALRPITTANGYTVSGVVVNGFVNEAIGGGLSQVSTTAFNAAFEAGLTDITHQPHSRWFSRYPEGREATIYDPTIDMVWENNTGYGVLVQAYVTDSHVVVTLWGTDVFDVDIVTGSRYNFRAPQTVYNERSDCQPESGGQSGFSVNVTRTVRQDGEVVEERRYSHTYSPWNRVVCGAPPSDDGGDDEG